jgi:hypothetical protein
MNIKIVVKLDWEVTPQQDYEVLELDIVWKAAPGELVYFRIVGDSGRVEYVPYKIVTTSTYKRDIESCLLCIPLGWIVDLKFGLICTIGPQELSRAGYRGPGSFWEDFYDNEGEARLILARLLKERDPESYIRYVNYYGDPAESGHDGGSSG